MKLCLGGENYRKRYEKLRIMIWKNYGLSESIWHSSFGYFKLIEFDSCFEGHRWTTVIPHIVPNVSKKIQFQWKSDILNCQDKQETKVFVPSFVLKTSQICGFTLIDFPVADSFKSENLAFCLHLLMQAGYLGS